MKVYIAATFSMRPSLRPHRDTIWQLGHEVVSTWLDETARPAGMSHSDFFKKLAIKDFAEIQSADLLICDTNGHSTGKNVELGFALAHFQRKQVWLVGPKHSVFHELADCQFDTWEECVEGLNQVGMPLEAQPIPTDDDIPF